MLRLRAFPQQEPRSRRTPQPRTAGGGGQPEQTLPEAAGGQRRCAAPGPRRATQDMVGGRKAIPASPGAASEPMLMGMETASGASTWKAAGEVWGQHLPILSAHPWRLHAVLCTDAAVSFHASVQLFFASVIQFAVTTSRVCESHSCALGLGFLQGRGCTEFKSRGQRASALRTLSQPLLFGHKKTNPNNRQYLPTQYFFLSYSETNFSSTSVPHICISYSQLPFYVFFLVMNYKSPIFIQF